MEDINSLIEHWQRTLASIEASKLSRRELLALLQQHLSALNQADAMSYYASTAEVDKLLRVLGKITTALGRRL